MKPGVSTILSFGWLNASQMGTKPAPFGYAGMSSVPAMLIGWLATIPTG
jgi:hypothetical protein